MAERPVISKPPLPKARGQLSYNQHAQLNARDSTTMTTTSNALPPLKTTHSASLPPIPPASIIHQQQSAYSPLIVHRRSPPSTVESYTHSTTNNVQLLSFQSRPESDYIKEAPRQPRPPPPPSVPVVLPKLLVTDFPVDEEPDKPLSSEPTAVIDKAFDYLPDNDDDDDDNDVIHREDSYEPVNLDDSFDDEDEYNSVNTHELTPRTNQQLSKTDSKFFLRLNEIHFK